MSQPSFTSQSPAPVPGCFHRAHLEEWSNYDSVAEEMRSIHYSYVEALRFSPDGNVVGMAKIGAYSTEPQENGTLDLDPDTPESFNFTGRWEIKDGHLTAELGPVSEKVTLRADWVGIFYLPTRITLTAGTVDANELRAQIAYDQHPIWEGVSAVFQRVDQGRS